MTDKSSGTKAPSQATPRTTKNKGGRPSKLTPKVSDALLQAVSLGMPYSRACLLAGVTTRTFERWITRADERVALAVRELASRELTDEELDYEIEALIERDPYCRFRRDLERAKAEGEVANLGIIQDAAADSWQAAAWLLERRYPETYGRRDRLNVVSREIGKDDLVSLEDYTRSERTIELAVELVEEAANSRSL